MTESAQRQASPAFGIPPLLLALIVAGILRGIWSLAIDVIPISDSTLYDAFARSIANGRGYAYPEGNLTAYWPVGTSMAYAVLYQLFGVGPAAIVAFNLVTGIGIVALTYFVARQYLPADIGIRAAWIVALWPLMIQLTTIYSSEHLFVFLFLGAAFVWKSSLFSPAIRTVVWAALLCGATYVRPTALPFFVLFPLLQWMATRNARQLALSLLIALLTAALLFSPWVKRNYQVFDAFVLVSTNFGTNLWMGNNPDSKGEYMQLPAIQFSSEVERNKYFQDLATRYIADHPLEYVKLSARRFVATFSRETIGVGWNEPGIRKAFGDRASMPAKFVSTLYWWAVLVAACAGLALAFRNRKLGVWHPLVLVTAFFLIVPVLTVGQDRYHVPMNPFFAMFAAIALAHVQARFRPGGLRPRL